MLLISFGEIYIQVGLKNNSSEVKRLVYAKMSKFSKPMRELHWEFSDRAN